MLFTPDHYQPPEIFISGEDGEDAPLTVEDDDDVMFSKGNTRYFKLNKNNDIVADFVDRTTMTDTDFAQVSYLYLLAAESQCQKRVSDISRTRSATNSSFGVLTMVSAITGAAIGTASGANLASGAAAIFNSLNSNADGLQSQITAQYSNNIATAIVKKQAQIINGDEKSEIKGIKDKISELVSSTSVDRETAKQSEIHYDLYKLNLACTIGAGEREIGLKLN